MDQYFRDKPLAIVSERSSKTVYRSKTPMHALVQPPSTPPSHQAGVAGRLFVLLTRVPPMWNFGEAKIFVFFHQAGPKFPKNQPFLRVYLIRPVRNRWNQQRAGRPLPVLDILEHAWKLPACMVCSTIVKSLTSRISSLNTTITWWN